MECLGTIKAILSKFWARPSYSFAKMRRQASSNSRAKKEKPRSANDFVGRIFTGEKAEIEMKFGKLYFFDKLV